jgi:ABC-2 type transport system permease protein
MATWSLTAFVTQRVLPTEFILRQIMRLNQLPPSLFGTKFLVAIVLFLPVVLTSTVPAMIFARNEFSLFMPLIASLILVFMGFIVSFKKTLKRFNGSGG